MRLSVLSTAVRVALVAATALAGQTAFANGGGGYVELSSGGNKVLTRCNPRNLPQRERCRVDSLPGLPGYALVASRSSAIVKNEVTVGTLYDRVWKKGNDFIFGMRVQMNAEAYDLTGLSFNVNDLFRQLRENQPASIAYYMGAASKSLKKAGRTLQGFNEPPPEDDDEDEEGSDEANFAADFTRIVQPVRNNAWVDFRIDANAAEASGPSSASSPWLLLKTKAPAGYAVKSFAVRVLSSDFADRSEHVEVFLSGYQPN